ncbi:ABC transporter ATP-binding protein [Longimicrobium terrae]|nr:ABC transporter ATP-binding protein [Longimicrobium terrae]
MMDLSRWRALGGLLWSASRWRVAFFGLVVALVGLLPTAVVLTTGALIQAIPGVIRDGLQGPGGTPALLALAGLAVGLAALAVGGNVMSQQAGVLDSDLALEVHHTVARMTLETPGVAPLEDPAVANELEAVQDAERRGVLQRPVTQLAGVVTARLRGLGAFAVLLGFRWWAPLVLFIAWQLTNRVYLTAMERGLSAKSGPGAERLRRSEYLRSLAVEPAAAKEIRVFGLAGWSVGQYGDAWMEALEVLWANRRASRRLNAAAIVALGVSHALVLGALGMAASRGEVALAGLFVFAQAVLATADLGLIGDAQNWTSQTLHLAGRLTALRERLPGHRMPSGSIGAVPAAAADGEPSEGSMDGVRAAPAGGAVALRLDGVRFTYRGRVLPTLDGLTLDVPAGQSLAVVGENGAGKSTLIKLLCGLYEPDGGRITLDGGRTPQQSRGRIAVIFQDFVRYRLPLRENVGFGHLGLMNDAAALEGALRDAGGKELLERLSCGWDTVLSREFQNGADLSGGQWQRVALARALTAVRGGAGLLILDEPTAALDVRAETELFERFLELTRGITTILVSHRLSSVRRADRIVVVDGGRVAEDGTHDELMKAGGLYATMYSLQADRFAAAPDGDAAEREVEHG